MSIHGERYRAAGSRLFVRGKQRPSNRPSSARRFRHLHPPIGNVSNWKLDSSGMSKIQGAKKPRERLENSIAFSNSVSFVTGDGGRDSTTVPSKMETGGDLVGNIKVIRAKQTLPVITQSRESHRVEHDGTFFLSLSLSLSLSLAFLFFAARIDPAGNIIPAERRVSEKLARYSPAGATVSVKF